MLDSTIGGAIVLSSRDRDIHSPSRCKREMRNTPQLKSTASDHFTVMV
jgi:hypothetical protein